MVSLLLVTLSVDVVCRKQRRRRKKSGFAQRTSSKATHWCSHCQTNRPTSRSNEGQNVGTGLMTLAGFMFW